MNQSTFLIFVACMIGALAIGIDFASVNLALPAIQSQFGIMPTLESTAESCENFDKQVNTNAGTVLLLSVRV